MAVRTVDNPYDPDPYTVDAPSGDFFSDNAPTAPSPTDGSGLGGVTATGYQPPKYTGDVAGWIRQVRSDLGLIANQSNHQSLQTLVDLAKKAGAPITMDEVDSNGHLGGLIINGQKQQLIDGSNNWTDPTPWPAESRGTSSAEGFQAPPPFSETFDYKPWTETFQAPDALSQQNDPGFQERLKQGQQALERSAAARGTLLTGGTLKGLQQFGQDFASNEYGNVYNRAAGAYQQKYNDYLGNYQRALGEYGMRYGQSNDQFNKALQTYQQARADQGQNFGQLYNLSSLDSSNYNAQAQRNLSYDSLYANSLQNGTNQSNDYLTGGSNATAAGQVGSTNAWSTLPNNLVNSGLSLYMRNKGIYGNPAAQPRIYNPGQPGINY